MPQQSSKQAQSRQPTNRRSATPRMRKPEGMSLQQCQIALRRGFGREQILTWWDQEEECYFGQCVELPMVVSHGSTPAEHESMVMEAMTLCVATLMEKGRAVPQPQTSPLSISRAQPVVVQRRRRPISV
jgi:predicted RNase H-like HicB family nuclease